MISAAYIGRLVFLTFFGAPRSEPAEHAHESPAVMTLPLVVLAIGASGIGLLIARTVDGSFSQWVEPLLGAVPEGTTGLALGTLIAIASLVSILTLGTMFYVYASGRFDWMALRVRLASVHRLFEHGWYVDDYYATVLVAPGKAASAILAFRFDTGFIDGIVNAIGGGTRRLAAVGRRIQTGYVRTYALAVFAGAVGILVFLGLRL